MQEKIYEQRHPLGGFFLGIIVLCILLLITFVPWSNASNFWSTFPFIAKVVSGIIFGIVPFLGAIGGYIIKNRQPKLLNALKKQNYQSEIYPSYDVSTPLLRDIPSGAIQIKDSVIYFKLADIPTEKKEDYINKLSALYNEAIDATYPEQARYLVKNDLNPEKMVGDFHWSVTSYNHGQRTKNSSFKEIDIERGTYLKIFSNELKTKYQEFYSTVADLIDPVNVDDKTNFLNKH